MHDHVHDHDHDHAAHDRSDDPVLAILANREAKDAFFAVSLDSPIPPSKRLPFDGLPYFPVDLAYRFAGLELAPYAGADPEEFLIPTSDGDLRPAMRAGSFRFHVGGQAVVLNAYDLGTGSLFVPFQDATSGVETYGAGRYLDLAPEPDGTFTLDFNAAYHPYCAYSPDYSCPLTPAENRLGVRIAAGERLAPDAG
jgi:uncharacterized protein (DUF1684 family)